MESECSLPYLQESAARLNSDVVAGGPQKTPKSLRTYLYYPLAYVWVSQVISSEITRQEYRKHFSVLRVPLISSFCVCSFVMTIGDEYKLGIEDHIASGFCSSSGVTEHNTTNTAFRKRTFSAKFFVCAYVRNVRRWRKPRSYVQGC